MSSGATLICDQPRRIQRQRTKGWRMPPNTVFIGRPSRYGNPFRIDHSRPFWWVMIDSDNGTPFRGELPAHRHAVQLYREEWDKTPADARERAIAALRGRNLACWCPDHLPCHADVLLELVNAPAQPAEGE